MPGTPSVQALCLDSDTTDSPPCLGSLTWFLRSIQDRLQRWGRTSPSASCARRRRPSRRPASSKSSMPRN